jgi:hypothetical protein
MMPVRRLLAQLELGVEKAIRDKIVMSDVEKAVENTKATVGKGMSERYLTWAERFGSV